MVETLSPKAGSTSADGENKQKFQSKSLFQQTSLDVWQLYKQSLRAMKVEYLKGREDAFNEVMKYLVMQNSNSDFRYVPIKEFISYIESRYRHHREECEVLTQTLQQSSMASPSPQTHNQALAQSTKEVQLAIDSLTKQAHISAEEQGPITQVQSRLAKLSFDIFKVKNTKKRRNPGLETSAASSGQGTDRLGPFRGSDQFQRFGSGQQSMAIDNNARETKHFKQTPNFSSGQPFQVAFRTDQQSQQPGMQQVGEASSRSEIFNSRPDLASHAGDPTHQERDQNGFRKIDFNAYLPSKKRND